MRLSQALSGWQRWLGGKILLVQVTEGKMHLERRGWEGLTKHQKKWGGEQKQKQKKKVEESSNSVWCLCCCYTEGPASPVYRGYLVTHTPGQEASV